MLYLISVLLGLMMMIFILLSFSSVQTWFAQKFASYLSKELKTEVHIGKVKLTWNMKIELDDFYVMDRHYQPMIKADKIFVGIRSISNKALHLNRVSMDGLAISMVKYINDTTFNFSLLTDYFTSKDTTASKPWQISCDAISMNNASFIMQDRGKLNFNPGSSIDFNNLQIEKINTVINHLIINSDATQASIQFLSFKERSGFSLVEMTSDFLLSKTSISLSKLKVSTQNSFYQGSLALKFQSMADFDDFINKINITAGIEKADINLRDLGLISKALSGMNDKVTLEGKAIGSLSKLKISDLKMRYGKSTYISGKIQLSGLPNLEETYLNLDLKEFHTSMADIDRFQLPGVNQSLRTLIPSDLANLGTINVNGNFSGFYNDFVAYGNFYSDAGNFKTDLSLRKDKKSGLLTYEGNLEANKIQAGKLLANEGMLGTVNFNMNISGTGLSFKTADVKFSGTIDSLVYNRYTYSHIEVQGGLDQKIFTGNLKLNDPNANLNFNGMVNLSQDIPNYNFNAWVENVHLGKLNFSNRDSNSVLKAQLKIDFSGNKPDNIVGNAQISNTSYLENGTTYLMKNLSLNSTIEKDSSKTLQFRSDFVDADFKGRFIFKDLVKSVTQFIDGYIPTFMANPSNTTHAEEDQQFTFSLNLINSRDLCKLFVPNLKIAPNSSISGKYSSVKSNLSINVKSNYIIFKNYLIDNFQISGVTQPDRFSIHTFGERFFINNTVVFDSLDIATDIKTDSVKFAVLWTDLDTSARSTGNISGNVEFPVSGFYKICLNQSNITINDSTWTTNSNNFISIDSNNITVNNLIFKHKDQELLIAGKISHQSDKKLSVNFSNFNLSNFDKVIDPESAQFSGIMNGTLEISKVYETPEFISNLMVKNFGFNGDKLGDAIINSKWDNAKNAIYANLEIIYSGNYTENKPIIANGYFYPKADKDNFAFDVYLENFKLKSIQHYVRGFCSSLVGKASGKLHLGGKANHPELTGKVMLQRTIMKIDYTNTEYNFADEISFSPNSINFNNITVSDDYGNKAIVTGKVIHDGFRNFSLDFLVEPRKFLSLNTNGGQNKNFYGKVFTTGSLKIKGPVEDLVLEATASPNKGSLFVVPISKEGTLKENNFISFVSKSVQQNIDSEFVNTSDISLYFDLLVNQDATVQINFDPQSGGTLKANGDGNLKIEVPKKGGFQMSGEYVLNDGDYYFNLQNIINKRFKIEKGGTIKWNGDPYDADINIRAIYRTKASLNDIAKGEDSSVYSKRIPIESILALSGKLANPTIKFNFDLPNSDNTVKSFVYNSIDTTNEQEMLRQTFSLLVMNRFMPTANSKTGNALGSGVEVTSTEIISTQLSNWLSQISKDFDIGVKYQSGDKLSNEELQVALSTQLFNDRVVIDGNIGVGGGSTANLAGKQNANQIVGDVQVEVKITQDGRFRVVAFNRANNNLLNYNTSLYTQGVGLFYRREFNKLSDLFRKSQKQVITEKDSLKK